MNNTFYGIDEDVVRAHFTADDEMEEDCVEYYLTPWGVDDNSYEVSRRVCEKVAYRLRTTPESEFYNPAAVLPVEPDEDDIPF